MPENFFAPTLKKTVRAPVNPLDRCTVVSIYPKAIHEVKSTIQPGTFDIEAGSYEKPSILIVESSSWWKETDENQPLLEIPQSSILVANSIVRDYCIGLLMADMETAIPGLFWVPGAWTKAEILKEKRVELDKARDKQRNWFKQLVTLADASWVHYGGNPLSISDDMRMAARELNLHDKEWLKDSQQMELIRCVACGSLRNPQYPVCANCKSVVDVVKAEKLGLQFAESKK